VSSERKTGTAKFYRRERVVGGGGGEVRSQEPSPLRKQRTGQDQGSGHYVLRGREMEENKSTPESIFLAPPVRVFTSEGFLKYEKKRAWVRGRNVNRREA